MSTVPNKNFLSVKGSEKLRFIIETKLPDRLLLMGSLSEVIISYEETWRHYHTLHHPLSMCLALETLDLSHLNTDMVHALYIAIIYHDSWYKVGREKGLNEEMSARMATKGINSAPIYREVVEMVTFCIIATTKHTLEGVPEKYHPVVGLMLDLDLMGLGQDSQAFAADTRKIWREYEPTMTANEYRICRISWAESFLNRDSIYHTRFFSHLEEKAQENLFQLAYL